MSEWGAQHLQAVWFIHPRETDAASIFAAIVGAKPDNALQMTVGSVLATGSNGISLFQVQTQPGRIDYFESAIPSSPAEFPLIVDVKKAIGAFTSRILNGSQSVGAAQRLAVVVTLCKQVESPSEAVQILDSLVGAHIPFSDASDINFQINRRRPIPGRDDLLMNRLFRMQPQIVQQIDTINQSRPVAQTINIACIVVDCNTYSPTVLTLEPSEQIPIWKELALEVERLCDAKSIKALG